MRNSEHRTRNEKSARLLPSAATEMSSFDPRVLTKNYGNAFLRGLPKCPVEVV